MGFRDRECSHSIRSEILLRFWCPDFFSTKIFQKFQQKSMKNVFRVFPPNCFIFWNFKNKNKNSTEKIVYTSIYDKRKDFNFKIYKFFNWNTCLKKTIFINVFHNQLLRISRTCNFIQAIAQLIYELKQELKENEFPFKFIQHHFLKFKHDKKNF